MDEHVRLTWKLQHIARKLWSQDFIVNGISILGQFGLNIVMIDFEVYVTINI